ncbi:uncharacterized protein LOC119168431 [Rhipicephalus microplus]|uniref:uncharacterized protein LOC119168431 n=1 Tax=Rhipicephalus microplus TaxID=6941 RepID=UPI003F6D9730
MSNICDINSDPRFLAAMDSSRLPFTLESVWAQRSSGLLAAAEHEIRLAERLQRQQQQEQASATMAPSHHGNEWRLSKHDTSHAGCWMRYTSFVLGVAAVASSTLFTAPVVFMARINSCHHGCLSLEHDLKASLNHNIHPCDDFYSHVCSGLDSKQGHPSLNKYSIAFSRSVLKTMLLGKIPTLSKNVRAKAARFMLRCLSKVQYRGISSLKAFLQELGLPWPHQSPATRPQLLDVIVRASLHFGIPLFWAFYIGRHPLRPLQNTIYMTLDPNFMEWARVVRALVARGRESEYLRRGAEIIGGEGQSYSFMIQHVIQVHGGLYDLTTRLCGSRVTPQFYNLTDSDLRRALNGYLPDDSQFWPEDEIVNLQPDFFLNLDSTYLSLSSNQESFKLFLGAYAVWLLSPIASGYLRSSLLADLGQENDEASYHSVKCFGTLEAIMPLVRFHLHLEANKNVERMRLVAQLSVDAFGTCLGSYGKSLRNHAYAVLAQLALNAFNMTTTWRQLNRVYAYLPSDRNVSSFFELYRRAALATASFFALSLRRPNHSIFHVPGISQVLQYRLLVSRELSIQYFLTVAPLYGTWEPTTVIAALFGTLVSVQLACYMRFVILYNHRFQPYQRGELGQDARRLVDDLGRLVLIVRNVLPNASDHEIREVYDWSFAAHVASYMLRRPKWLQTSAGGWQDTSFEKDRLFFYLVCYAQCGTENRERLRKMAACNVGLPAAPLFRKAFKCQAGHHLVKNFTWPEPGQPTVAESL